MKRCRPFFSLGLGLLLLSAADARGSAFDMPQEDSGGAGGVSVRGLMDLRFVRTSRQKSWLYDVVKNRAGTNKLRYGGKDITADEIGDRPATQFAIPQASLVVEAPVWPKSRLHLQANFDADFETGNGAAGLVEAYAVTEHRLARHDFRARLGAFVPPLSWEHPELAWSTRYTLTPSAMASWAGEDLRAFGAEGAWRWQFSGPVASQLTAGLFSGSDQTGWILLVRGWALHDYQPDLNFTYKIQEGGGVETNRPFKELDGRLGHYARLNLHLWKGLAELQGGAWDNNTDINVQTIGSHLDAYHAAFRDYGLKLSHRRLTLMAQGLKGSVESKSFAKRDFDAGHVLLSLEWRRLRASARGDRFEVDKLEKGRAWSGALSCRVSPRQRITAEYVHAATDPFGAPKSQRVHNRLFSLNHRWLF